MQSSAAHSAPTQARAVNVAIPPELHRALKVRAASTGETLQNVVERALRLGLRSVPSGCDVYQQNGTNSNQVPVESSA